MNRIDFKQLTEKSIVILDGATGTELAKRGLPAGVCPEDWILNHPQAIIELQSNYVQAGTNIVYAPTFGANRHKLSNFGLQDKVSEMNRQLVNLSRQAVAGKAYVFGDIAPTGLMVEPMPGGAPFEDVVTIYKEQIHALLDAGVDGFAIETMLDIQEARAALIAVREITTDIPVIVTMTYEKEGRTLTGTDPASAVIILQALGADAVGCNCSAGPEDMIAIVAAMQPFSRVPLVAKPNAGLPKVIDGKTVFDMDAAAFSAVIPQLISAGANILGGCCGTTPEHIRLTAETARNSEPPRRAECVPSCLASARNYLPVSLQMPFAIIGERINPTGKKALQAELRQNDFTLLRSFAREQEQHGAAILDVNLGLPGGDERALMIQAIKYLSQDTALPLCIDTTKPEVAEAALRLYPGRALFNSISAETTRLKDVLPIVAKYGAMLIILPLEDSGIPLTTEKRIELVQKIFAEASRFGYKKEDVAVDGLVMTVSANPTAAATTLDLIDWTTNVWKTNAVCGLSNISFGLPRRDLINRAFLGMAIGRGLNMAIANPMLSDIVETTLAGNVLNLTDDNAKQFVKTFANVPAATASPTAPQENTTVSERIATAVISGDDSSITKLLNEAIAQGIAPGELVDKTLIPAITTVGDKYEKKEFFLPQLLAAAKTMRAAMDFLTPLLSKVEHTGEKREKIIIATVEGDIHDIGKNIVGMMLNNYGFEVIDLGKDVSASKILDTAVRENVRIIGLSALMTTTMTRMKECVELARERNLNHLEFIVGGAVLDQTYADSIGAHYAPDAMATVRIAQSLQ